MSVHVGIPVKACCKTLNNANLKSQLKLNINRVRILIMICYFWIFAITYSLITSYIKQEFKDSLIEISYFFDIRNSIAVEFADTISSLKVKSLNIRSILHFHIQWYFIRKEFIFLKANKRFDSISFNSWFELNVISKVVYIRYDTKHRRYTQNV